MGRTFVYVFAICLQLADAAKLSIHDKAFDWSKVELGLVLNEEPITLSVAEAAITALLYAPGAATETNAVALCEKGIFGLQNQVELKLKAEQAAAEGPEEAQARLDAVRKEYLADLSKCVRNASQYENVRATVNAALNSAKTSNMVVDPVESLEQQKKALELMVRHFSNGTVTLSDSTDSGRVQEVVGSGNETVEVAVAANPDGEPDGGNSQLERIASDIRQIDELIRAAREGGSTSSETFHNALAALSKARSEEIAMSPTPAMTELLATEVTRRGWRAAGRFPHRTARRDHVSATGGKQRTVRDDLAELLLESTKDAAIAAKQHLRRLLHGDANTAATLADIAREAPTTASEQLDTLLSDVSVTKHTLMSTATAKQKWHWHHRHHNHHWHHRRDSVCSHF